MSGRGHPPRGSAVRVDRPRLLAALSDPATGARVTVLRAPAGFGKTTLLRHWCETRRDVAWVTAGPAGDASGRRWPRIVGDALVGAGAPAALVLDNVDAVEPEAPEELLGVLRSRPDLRVILSGRGESWFPDNLLEDIGATVIGADELAFTPAETSELLSRTLAYLHPRHGRWTDQVHRTTGGWPELTVAVARRMAVAPDPIDLAAIAARTAAEFLRRRLMPELERANELDLALVTAATDRFSAELADAVTRSVGIETAVTRSVGAHSVGATRGSMSGRLDGLVRAGLLVRETVGAHTVYRWPEAARAVLLDELTLRGPDRFTALHAAWATELLADGRPREAVPHVLAARDWPLLVTVIDTAWRSLLRDDSRVIRDALAAAPVEALAGSAPALALREILLFTPGSQPNLLPIQPTPPLPSLPASAGGLARLATTEQLAGVLDTGLLVVAAHRHRGRQAASLADARRLLEVANTAHPARPVEVARHRAAIQLAVGVGLLITGDIPAAVTALELAHGHGAAATGSPGWFAASGAAALLSLSHAVLGDVTSAHRWRDRMRAIAVSPVDRGGAMTHLHVAAAAADLLMAVDEADGAGAEAAKDRLALLDTATPWLDLWAFVCYADAQYALHHGDVDAALDRIIRARATHGHDLGDEGIAAPLLAAAEADLLMAAGRGNLAQRALRQAPEHWLLRVPAARLALLSGGTREAARLAADKVWQRSAGTRDRIEMRLIRAIAARRSGDPRLARAVVARAGRAAREAGVRSVWDTVPAAELDALRGGGLPSEQSRPATAGYSGVYPDSIVLVELTEREQHVLDHVATGVTLEQVAATLTISPNTVKTHVTNVYRKLRVDSRAAAVAEAGRLGLLTPSRR